MKKNDKTKNLHNTPGGYPRCLYQYLCSKLWQTSVWSCLVWSLLFSSLLFTCSLFALTNFSQISAKFHPNFNFKSNATFHTYNNVCRSESLFWFVISRFPEGKRERTEWEKSNEGGGGGTVGPGQRPSPAPRAGGPGVVLGVLSAGW